MRLDKASSCDASSVPGGRKSLRHGEVTGNEQPRVQSHGNSRCRCTHLS